jgi:hypothetical protein
MNFDTSYTVVRNVSERLGDVSTSCGQRTLLVEKQPKVLLVAVAAELAECDDLGHCHWAEILRAGAGTGLSHDFLTAESVNLSVLTVASTSSPDNAGDDVFCGEIDHITADTGWDFRF